MIAHNTSDTIPLRLLLTCAVQVVAFAVVIFGGSLAAGASVAHFIHAVAQ